MNLQKYLEVAIINSNDSILCKLPLSLEEDSLSEDDVSWSSSIINNTVSFLSSLL
jgi:hypothetical protein